MMNDFHQGTRREDTELGRMMKMNLDSFRKKLRIKKKETGGSLIFPSHVYLRLGTFSHLGIYISHQEYEKRDYLKKVPCIYLLPVYTSCTSVGTLYM